MMGKSGPDSPDHPGLFPADSPLAGLVESVPAIVYEAEMGREGRWHYVSGQIEQLLGYTPDEWLASPNNWIDAVHPDDRDYVLTFEDDSYVGVQSYSPAEYRLRTKSGRYIWVLEQANLIRPEDEGPPVWHGVIQDIDDLKQAEARLKDLADKHELTSRLGATALSNVSLDQILEETVSALISLPGIHNVSIRQSTADNKLELLSGKARPGTDYRPAEFIPFDPAVFPGSNLASGETIWVEDWETDEGPLAAFRKFLASPEIRSTFVIPVNVRGRPFGAVLVNSDQPHHFSANDNYFLRAIAHVLSSSIERNQVNRELRHRLLHDPLTKLPNRELFKQRLDRSIEVAAREGNSVAVLFLDLDHFKLINDGIGHHAGDEMLREVAPRLVSAVGQGDTVARFGGDEFGIVLNDVDGVDGATGLADRILATLDDPITVELTRHHVTASIGVSVYDPAGDAPPSSEDLIQEADAAMYEAKDLGRSRSQAFDQRMQDLVRERLDVERDLRRAIDGGELELYYQPTVSLATGRIRSFEALVRWNHPARGLLTPGDFIPIAEESDLITSIDTWVLTEACRQNGIWNRRAREGDSYLVAVNTSARRVHAPELSRLVRRQLAVNDLKPDQLALEITESALMVGTPAVKATLTEIHGLGVRLILDDFGTGFSALSYLSEFPFGSIKIDRSFVDQLGRGQPEGTAITEAIINVGKALSMTTIAEAVNTPAQLQLLRDLGCDHCQSYLTSPPLPATETEKLIEDPDRIFLPASGPADQPP